jgi:hypothetical protein
MPPREIVKSFAGAIGAVPLRGLGANCYELYSSPLYIKVGSMDFWGLTKNRLEALERRADTLSCFWFPLARAGSFPTARSTAASLTRFGSFRKTVTTRLMDPFPRRE